MKALTRSSMAGVAIVVVLLAGVSASAATPNVYVSSNWAGYVVKVPRGAFYQVFGGWVVPTVTCSPGENSASSTWVGLGGSQVEDLYQIGTNSRCIDGVPTYQAFLEHFPVQQPSEILTLRMIGGQIMPVQPGKAVEALVTLDATRTSATYTLLQFNSADRGPADAEGFGDTRALPVRTDPRTAECITESSTFPGHSQPGPLSNFGLQIWDSCSAASGTADSSFSNVFTPPSNWTLTKWELGRNTGANPCRPGLEFNCAADTGNVAADGMGFAITWHSKR